MKRKIKLVITLVISLIIITIAIFLLIYMKQNDEYSKYNYGPYFATRIEKSSYYNSGFEKSGNDYYSINITDEKRPDNYYYSTYYDESIPAKYILSRDMQYEQPWDIYDMQEYIEYIPEQEVKKFIVNVYDIESGELVDSVDVKNVLDDYRGNIYLSISDAAGAAVDNRPVIRVNVYDKACSISEFEDEAARRCLIDIDLATREHNKKREKDNKERLGKRLDMEVFNRSDKGRIHTNFYIYSERYWDGTVKMTLFDINKLNENYTKLYEKFPGLKEDIDTLKKKGQTAELNIILTGNPSYEEIAKLVSEEGKELPFDDVWVGAKYSVDGSVHLINNFNEWRKYYRIDEKDVSMLSPIFPRQLK